MFKNQGVIKEFSIKNSSVVEILVSIDKIPVQKNYS